MSLSNQYRSYGLNCVPCNAQKYPTLKEYTQYYSTPYTGDGFDGAYGIGILCGKTSGNLEVIDIDSKYQEHRDLFGGMRELVCNIDSDLWEKLVIEQSPSGGYHLFFRCEKIEGNQKLANRLANESEIEAAKASGSKPPKQVVLIETRGEGGFIVCAPTPGYTLVQSDFSAVHGISAEEREILMDCARSFNEVHIEKPIINIIPTQKVDYGTDDVPSWVDYNNRHTCLELLQGTGWKVISQRGDMIHLLRPGTGIKSQKSATYFPSRNKVVFFTSSSEFDTWQGKGSHTSYNPFKIYTLWHHAGDGKAAAKALYQQGYGTRKKPSAAAIQENPKKKDFQYKVRKSTIEAGSEKIAPTLDLAQSVKDADTIFLFLENGKDIAEKYELPHFIVDEKKRGDDIQSLVGTLGKEKEYAICGASLDEAKKIAKCLAYYDVLAKVYIYDIEKIDHFSDNDTGDITLAKDKMQKELMPILNYLISSCNNPLEDVWQLLYCFPSTARIQFLIATLPNKPQGLKDYCRQGLKARKQEDKEAMAADAEENSVIVRDGVTLAKNYQGVLSQVCEGELSIPFQIPGENDNECEWIMSFLTRDENDKKKQVFLRIDNEQIGSQSGLEKVFRNARIQFKANKAQIVNLNNALIPASKTAEKNDTLGWHKDSKLWFWHNQAFCYKEQIFLEPNEISIIDHQGGSIYLPHCDTSRRSKKSQNDFTSSFAFRKSEITMHDISSWYHKQWGEQGVLVLLWGVASAYVDFISQEANAAAPFFPLIYCQGQKGSGKTTMLEVLRFFYTRKIETISLRSSNNTAAAIQSILSKYSGVPILFDDFGSPEGKASTDIATGIGVSAFNRRVEAKRDMNDLSKVQDPTIYATLAYSSNYYPKDSSGAFQDRCIYFKFDRTVFSQEESEAFLSGLQRWESEGLCSAFIIEVISNRQHIEAHFQATYKQLLAYFKNTTTDYEIGSRQISIYAMVTAIGIILIKQGVSFSLSEKQLKEAARAAIIKQHTTLQSKNPVQVFWEVVQAGIDAGIVTLGMYYDYRPTGYTSRTNPGKAIKGEVIIVNLPLMYRFYAQEMRRMGQEPEKKGEIEDEIERSTAFVSTEVEGQPISRLSAWRFDASDAEQEETKSKVTVALALKLGELQKQYGFSMKKTK